MNIESYDLDKYKNWLWAVSDDLEQLPNYKFRYSRITYILYLLSRRSILGMQTPKGEEIREILEAEQSELTAKIERTQQIENMYLGEIGKLCQSKVGLCHFFPDWKEKWVIDQFRRNYLSGCKNDLWDTLRATALTKNVIIERNISEIKYTYTEFYDSGKPVTYKGERNSVIIAFASDLGKFDFLRFLLDECESVGHITDEIKPTKNPIQSLDYRELFDSPKKLEFVEKMLIDKGFWSGQRALIGDRDKFKILALCDALKFKGIVLDLDINVICDSFVLRLKVQAGRLRDRSKYYEFYKEQYINYIKAKYSQS